MARHISMRGEAVDFNRLTAAHAKQPALGNASKNARGDVIDSSGSVIRTQEQIQEDWRRRKAQREALTRPVDIKAELPSAPAAVPTQTALPQPQPAPATPAVQAVEPDGSEFEPAPQPMTPEMAVAAMRKRKITEAE